MHLSVIIPAYNEERRIGATLEDIRRYLSRQSYRWEIIVVNNNSQDQTAQVVWEYQRKIPQLRVLHERRQGKGAAVAVGMLKAQGQYRLFTDADNATTIDQIERFFPYVRQGYEVIIGSIAVAGAQVLAGGREPFWRVILGKLGNKWIQLVAVWGIHDTQRGFKLFTARAVRDIFPRLTVFGWGFDVEALALARTLGYKIKEVPVTWKNDPHSKVNLWAYPKVLLETLKVRWNLLTGRYETKDSRFMIYDS